MIPYVAETFQVTTANTVRLTYHCEACGQDSPAVVSAVTRGYAEAPLMIGGDAARARATAGAYAALPAEVQFNVGLAGCPQCAKPAAKSARSARLRALGRGFGSRYGIFISIILLGGVIELFQGDGAIEKLIGLGIIAAAFILISPMAIWKYKKLVREAQSLVVWNPES